MHVAVCVYQVDCAAVKSMQVSKASSAKPLLKLVGASTSAPDTTFDFSLVPYTESKPKH